jgi:transcriptional regulator
VIDLGAREDRTAADYRVAMSLLPPSRFDARTPADNERLMREHPFAWVVSADDAAHAGMLHATPLPLRVQCDAHGDIRRVVGHFARRNPQVAALQRQPQALFLFLGPHGYVSPSWMADRTQAPTWNYASVRCLASVRFIDDAQRLRGIVRDLVDAHEVGRPRQWRVDDMGPRYEQLARGIIGFEAEVDEVQGRFKLGQDERDDVFADIVRGLAGQGAASDPLRAWMNEFNPGRAAQ